MRSVYLKSKQLCKLCCDSIRFVFFSISFIPFVSHWLCYAIQFGWTFLVRMDWIMPEDKWFTFGRWLKLMFLEIFGFFFVFYATYLTRCRCSFFSFSFCLIRFSFLSVFHNDFVVLYNFFPLNLFRPKWLMVLRITSILLYRANASIYYKCFLFVNVYEHCVWFGGENIFFFCLSYFML